MWAAQGMGYSKSLHELIGFALTCVNWLECCLMHQNQNMQDLIVGSRIFDIQQHGGTFEFIWREPWADLVAKHGFALHWSDWTDFTNALCLHYDLSPPHLPSQCARVYSSLQILFKQLKNNSLSPKTDGRLSLIYVACAVWMT